MLAIKGSSRGITADRCARRRRSQRRRPRDSVNSWSRASSSARAGSDEALLQQAASGKRLGELLVELGAIDDFDLARVLASRLDLPVADLRKDTPEDDAIALIPESLARAHVAIPVRKTEIGLQMAMADPQDDAAVQMLADAAGTSVIRMVAPPSDIRRAIDKSYRALAGVGRHVDAFLAAEAIHGADGRGVGRRRGRARGSGREPHRDPGAARPRVRHPHRAAGRRSVRVRFRVDGALHDVAQPARPTWAPALVSRIKIMAEHEHRRAPACRRTARSRSTVDGRPLDIRVATTPTIWGEKAVLRLLDKSRSLLPARATSACRPRRTTSSRS